MKDPVMWILATRGTTYAFRSIRDVVSEKLETCLGPLDERDSHHFEENERTGNSLPSASLGCQADHSARGSEEKHDIRCDCPTEASKVQPENVIDDQLESQEKDHEADP